MLVARSRIPRVSSTAWGCPLAVPPGAAPEHRRYASTACAQRTSRGGCSHDALLAVGPFGLPLQDALSRCASRCRANPDDSKRARPPMNRNVGVCPPVLEHRNDKWDPRATTLTKKGPREEGTRSPQHNSLPLGARGPRPEQRVRRQRLDWRGRPLGALLDSFGRRPPHPPQSFREH